MSTHSRSEAMRCPPGRVHGFTHRSLPCGVQQPFRTARLALAADQPQGSAPRGHPGSMPLGNGLPISKIRRSRGGGHDARDDLSSERSHVDNHNHRRRQRGSTLARHLVRGGERVALASKRQAQAEEFAQQLGPLARAASVEDAIAGGDAVVFAVWVRRGARTRSTRLRATVTGG
jgi:NADP oxidoreductase coenzyme F420-dependent